MLMANGIMWTVCALAGVTKAADERDATKRTVQLLISVGWLAWGTVCIVKSCL